MSELRNKKMQEITLVSLSSPKGGGKDLVCKIIQMIEAWKHSSKVFQDDYIDMEDYIITNIDDPTYINYSSSWVNEKFAKKLKQMLAIPLGIHPEQLEDRVYKDTPLPTEWDLWEVKYKKEERTYIFTKYFTYESDIEDWSFETGNYIQTQEKISSTPRLLMQLIGTEAIRIGLHKNAWVNALFSDYIPRDKGVVFNREDMSIGSAYSHKECSGCKKSFTGFKRARYCNKCIKDESLQIYPKWIITDTRFENEFQAIKARGGITVRIDASKRLDILRVAKAERLAQLELMEDSKDIFYQSSDGDFHIMNNAYQEKYTKLYNKYFNEIEDTHASENEWKTFGFDYSIDNNKGLPHLIKEVKKFVKHYNLV